MIKGSATIQFGSGSVVSIYETDEKSNVGVVLMRSCPPGRIGRRTSKTAYDRVYENPEVIMYFTNVESLDNIISNLTELRKNMSGKEEV